MKKPFRLIVSGTGTVYIARTLDNPGLMSENRFQVSDEDFLFAIEKFARARIKEGHDALEVKNENGERTLTIGLK